MQLVEDIAPLPVAPAVPMIDDDESERIEILERHQEAREESAREEAFMAEYTWQRWNAETRSWHRYRLEIGLDRWTWWHRMELHNAPIPEEAWNDTEKWGDGHVPTAWSLLYLCSHEPDTILSLVPSPKLYWFAVNEWAAIHCPGEKWNEALVLMRQIEQQMKLTIALPRPTKAKRGRSGNETSP